MRELKKRIGIMKSDKGFTLIETLVYLALFSIIITGALVGVYSIIESSHHNQAKALVQEEGTFMTGKVDWALANAKTIVCPDTSGCVPASYSSNTLTIKTYSGDTITIQQTGSNLQIIEGTNPPVVLNNDNVKVSCPASNCFNRLVKSADGINPESLVAMITVTTQTQSGLSFSQDFTTVKYLRR